MTRKVSQANKARRKALMAMPCSTCRSTAGVCWHHIIGYKLGGMGYKTPDEYTIPLCYACHYDIHFVGHKTWEEKWNKTQMQLLDETNKQLEFNSVR